MSSFLDPPCSSGADWSKSLPIVKHNTERTFVDVCKWSNRFAPLESDAAPVGGECETVSSLNCSSSEAETVFRQYFMTNVETKYQI